MFVRRLPLILLLALCCLAAAKKKPAVPATPPGTLGGHVFSRSGTPVAGAAVHVWKEGEKKKETATIKPDEKGEFRVPIAEGTYEVQATAAQSQPAVPMRITVVVHAQQVTWVNLEMVP